MKTTYLCFPGGRFKALTFSYDDGRAADRRLVEIFNTNRLKGTFHLNAGLLGTGDRISATDLQSLYTGHEVACHSYSHPTLARCPRALIAQELMNDRRELENWLDYPVRGLSYPNGSYNSDIEALLPHLGIAYARTVNTTGSFGLPEAPYRWAASCHHNHNLLGLTNEFLALTKKQYLYLFYVWGHSYEFDNDDNWNLIETIAAKLGGHDDIWYATNIEIIDYLEGWRSLRFSADCRLVSNPQAFSLWLSVDGESLELPGGATVKL